MMKSGRKIGLLLLLLLSVFAFGKTKKLTEKEYHSPWYYSPGKLHNELVRRGWFVEETYFLPKKGNPSEGEEIPLDDYALNEINAIKRAEAWLNIPCVGRQSEEIWRKLALRPQPVDILAETTPSGYFIVINKTLLSATLYKDRQVVKKMPVAVGRDPNATPSGKWHVAVKLLNPAWGGNGEEPMTASDPNNPLGEYWMAISYINKKGQHSIGIHGTSRFRKGTLTPGTLASSGCMRLINSEAKWLYETIPMKTPVWIGFSDELAKLGVVQKDRDDRPLFRDPPVDGEQAPENIAPEQTEPVTLAEGGTPVSGGRQPVTEGQVADGTEIAEQSEATAPEVTPKLIDQIHKTRKRRRT
ncbi:MAG: L,D-transpeptidase [Fusobacteriaceae bacterium]|jgi:hypothetical protein|nr:L,D-transpeptidase [Fusobacteriaceae bacterium]